MAGALDVDGSANIFIIPVRPLSTVLPLDSKDGSILYEIPAADFKVTHGNNLAPWFFLWFPSSYGCSNALSSQRPIK